MKIKQLLSAVLALGAVLLIGCQKDPSTSNLRREYLVYTAYDRNADFTTLDTYYIPDSILLIGSQATDSEGNRVAKYWKDGDALTLIGTIVDQMTERGYTRLTDGALRHTADAGFQLSYIEQTTYFTGYNNPYWWWDYPYYWTPDYWGYWSGWYYPFAVYYGYTTGSLLVEMVDLQNGDAGTRKLPILWNVYISGLVRGSNQLDIPRAVDALDQAFEQSPYLKK